MTVTAEKALRWSQTAQDILDKGVLASSEASKMAGRLSFASQHTFRRLGRGMVRPLFAQQYKPLPGGRLGPLLVLALKWWRQALMEEWSETVPWTLASETVELHCDARSTPARVAAVLVIGSKWWYTDWAPSDAVVSTFLERSDCQIMALELLAVAVALCTFSQHLTGRNVRIWTDNVGSEGALRAGAAKAGEHNLIVHGIWLLALRRKMDLWIERVPTDDNVSDLPSRESYGLMEALSAVWVAPRLDSSFREPTKWESVALHGQVWALSTKRKIIYPYIYIYIYQKETNIWNRTRTYVCIIRHTYINKHFDLVTL